MFGIGSMIYTGIEIGLNVTIYFNNNECVNIITVIRPGLQILFVFTQMYFVFLNQKVQYNAFFAEIFDVMTKLQMNITTFQMNIYKHKMVGRLGLMHMIATNICVWLHVLIEETKHEMEHAKWSNESNPNMHTSEVGIHYQILIKHKKNIEICHKLWIELVIFH